MKKPNKQKELEEKLNKILRNDWNPIGGSDIPNDEYVNYIPRIYEALSENCDVYYLTQMMVHITENVIGIKSNWYETLKVAEKLITQLQKEIVELKHKFFRDRMMRSAKKAVGRKFSKKDVDLISMFHGDKEIGNPYK